MFHFDWQLCEMTEADLIQVVHIEQACYPQPWSEIIFKRELDNPLSHLFLCTSPDEVVGYVCLWDVAGEVEIHNVATAPHWQRKGVAAYLMRAVQSYMDQHGIDSAFLEVRRSNVKAIALYEKCAFRVLDCRRGYYAEGEDALLMGWQRDMDKREVDQDDEKS